MFVFFFFILLCIEKWKASNSKRKGRRRNASFFSGFIQASGFFGENEKAFFFYDSRLYWFLDLFARVEKGKKAVLYTYSSSALLCVSYIESRSMMVVFTARGVFRKQQMDGNDYLDGNEAALSMLEWKQTQKFIPYSAQLLLFAPGTS